MKGLFSPELEKLIEITIADGVLTDQEKAFENLSKLKVGALFMEMGTGKTKGKGCHNQGCTFQGLRL